MLWLQDALDVSRYSCRFLAFQGFLFNKLSLDKVILAVKKTYVSGDIKRRFIVILQETYPLKRLFPLFARFFLHGRFVRGLPRSLFTHYFRISRF